jgi:hypothetical protein
MDRLSLELDSSGWIPYIVKEHTGPRLWIRKHRAWKLTVNSKSRKVARTEGDELEGSELYAKLLPPRPTAWIVLLHDLAWTWKPESVPGNLVDRLCQELNEYNKPEADSQLQPEPPKTKQRLNTSVDLPLWAVWKNESTYKHFPLPDFKTFRELDRFFYIWSRGIEWLEKPKLSRVDLPKQIRDITSLWALAGRTVLLDAYRDFEKLGHDWYMDFAEEGDNWFKVFMETNSTAFEERFEEFRGKREKLYDYPTDGNEQIKAWRARLDSWDKDVANFENEVLAGLTSSRRVSRGRRNKVKS